MSHDLTQTACDNPRPVAPEAPRRRRRATQLAATLVAVLAVTVIAATTANAAAAPLSVTVADPAGDAPTPGSDLLSASATFDPAAGQLQLSATLAGTVTREAIFWVVGTQTKGSCTAAPGGVTMSYNFTPGQAWGGILGPSDIKDLTGTANTPDGRTINVSVTNPNLVGLDLRCLVVTTSANPGYSDPFATAQDGDSTAIARSDATEKPQKPSAAFLRSWRQAELLYWRHDFLRAYAAINKLKRVGSRLEDPRTRLWLDASRVKISCQAGHGAESRQLARRAYAYINSLPEDTQNDLNRDGAVHTGSTFDDIFATGDADGQLWSYASYISYFNTSHWNRQDWDGGPDTNIQVMGSPKTGYCPGDGKVISVSVQDGKVRPGGRVRLLVIGAGNGTKLRAQWMPPLDSRDKSRVFATETPTVHGTTAYLTAPTRKGAYRVPVFGSFKYGGGRLMLVMRQRIVVR